MTRRRFAVILVFAATLVLAGCNTGTGGTTTTNATTADTATTETDTTAPGDGGGGTVDPANYPAGVTAAGLTNATALLQADWSELNDTGFTAELEANTTRGGTPSTTYQRTRIEAGSQRALQVRNRSRQNSDSSISQWRNRSLRLSRILVTNAQSESNALYRRSSDTAGFQFNPGFNRQIIGLLSIGDYTITSSDGTGDDARITLTADGINESRNLRANVTDYQGQLVVDTAGRIRSVQISANVTRTGRLATSTTAYQLDYDLTSVGDVTVEQPPWFETALSDAPDIDISATLVDGRYVRIDNRGPDPLEPGWRLSLQGRRPYNTNLTTPIQSGDSVYIFIPSDGRQLEMATSPPTNETRQLTGLRVFSIAQSTEVTQSSYPITSVPVNGTQAATRQPR